MNIWKQFHLAGFESLWYAHPGQKRYGTKGCWFAGIWTGPHHDLICVKQCDTIERAEFWLSPGGDTPQEAVRLAIKMKDQFRKVNL